MSKLAAIVPLIAAALLAGPVSADNQPQSGSLSAATTSTSCEIGVGGTFTGGGSPLKFLSTTLTTSAGTNLALDIRPSLTTGLFTQTKVDTSVNSASVDVGIEVCVTVDGSGAAVLPKSCVVYNQRFQQISTQVFSQIATCFATITPTACTIDSDCAFLGAGFICNNPTGASAAGVCASGPNPLCNFDAIQSSLSANSFDFVVPVSSKKTHTIEASWKVIGAGGSSGNASALTCVGPGILTATQFAVDNITTSN